MEKLSGGGFNQKIWPSVSRMSQNKLDVHACLNIPATTVHPTNLYAVVVISLAVTVNQCFLWAEYFVLIYKIKSLGLAGKARQP